MNLPESKLSMKKNYLYNLLLSVVNILFPLLSFPYAAHILGPVGIGKIQFIVSFAQYFAIFAALGIPIYGIKETAKYKNDSQGLSLIFTELTSIFFIASLFFSFVYFIVIFSFSFFAHDREMYLFAGVLILFSFTYTDWFYSGIEEFKTITVRSIFIKSISLVLIYTFIQTEADFKNYLFIMLFSILGYQLVSFLMIFKRSSLNFRQLNIKKHINPLIYIFSGSIVSSMYSVFDTVLLGFLSNNRSVGLYTASSKLIKITLPFVTSMGAILIPSISKNMAENNMSSVTLLLEKSFRFLVFFSIPICFGLAILSPELILLFSGKQFVNAISTMRILSLLPIFVGFGHFFSFQILIPAGKNREMFLSMLVGLITSFILNFILVPTLLYNGAAIANITAELFVTIGYFYFVKKHLKIHFEWKLITQTVVTVIFFLPIIILIRFLQLSLISTIALSLITCTAFYFSIQLFLFKNKFVFTFIKPIK